MPSAVFDIFGLWTLFVFWIYEKVGLNYVWACQILAANTVYRIAVFPEGFDNFSQKRDCECFVVWRTCNPPGWITLICVPQIMRERYSSIDQRDGDVLKIDRGWKRNERCWREFGLDVRDTWWTVYRRTFWWSAKKVSKEKRGQPRWGKKAQATTFRLTEKSCPDLFRRGF